jgi:purine catabolism regulator
MRARLPAFESVRGGELALVAFSLLHRHGETLPHLLHSLHQEGIAAVAIAAPSIAALGNEAPTIADQLHLPLILLPQSAPLEEIEREVITFVVSFRGEIERRATEISHQLMQLSIQGTGIKGLCEQLARSCEKWVILQDAEQRILYQVAPLQEDNESLPATLADDALQQANLTRIGIPIQIRHEVVGHLSLIGRDGSFDYLERLILGQVAPILALEFARERERSEVETRYQTEAFMDVLQGNYQQPEEMLARARILGYDLTVPQVVAIFELAPTEPEYPANSPYSQWNRRIRDELLRAWPESWILSEPRRVTALLPYPLNGNNQDSLRESEQTIFKRLERVQARVQQHKGSDGSSPAYSGGFGHLAAGLQDIPQSYRQARQALEVGQRLFGEGNLHSFARLGIYRLLFHLYGQEELVAFYREMLGPLVDSDYRNNGALIETLEAFFRCNGNLSETARSMHLHRNSLLYRLGRIEELLGRPLEDSELRLSLQIALKIRHLFQNNSKPG